MKKIRAVPNFNNIRKEIYEETKKIIDNEINEANSRLSESDKKYLSSNFRILMILLGFILLVPWYILWYKTSKIKSSFVNSINQNEVYKAAFEKVPELEFVKSQMTNTRKDLFINRVPGIPKDAYIDKASPLITFKVLGKYNASIRMGRATWVRTNGKSTSRYYSNTGYSIINAQNVMPKFTYELNHRNKFGGKKYDLESTRFNKEFEFKFNDGVKARMIYTPLAMEETIKYKATNNLKYWNVVKANGMFNIRFKPKDWRDLEINISNRDLGSLEKIKNAIYSDIAKDVTNIYNIIYVTLIPPML